MQDRSGWTEPGGGRRASHILVLRLLLAVSLVSWVLLGYAPSAFAQAAVLTSPSPIPLPSSETALPGSEPQPAPSNEPPLPGSETEPGKVEEQVSGFGLEVQGGTRLPVTAGAQVVARFPLGFRGVVGIGWLPETYVSWINGLAGLFDGYSDQTADVVQRSLKNSMALDFHLGWEPTPPGGFYIEAGYNLFMLGGDSTPLDMLSLATGKSYPDSPFGVEVPVESRAHNIVLELGYEFIIMDFLSITLGAGAFKTLAAHNDIQSGVSLLTVKDWERQSENYLNDIYTKYVGAVYLSLWLGWRVF